MACTSHVRPRKQSSGLHVVRTNNCLELQTIDIYFFNRLLCYSAYAALLLLFMALLLPKHIVINECIWIKLTNVWLWIEIGKLTAYPYIWRRLKAAAGALPLAPEPACSTCVHVC